MQQNEITAISPNIGRDKSGNYFVRGIVMSGNGYVYPLKARFTAPTGFCKYWSPAPVEDQDDYDCELIWKTAFFARKGAVWAQENGAACAEIVAWWKTNARAEVERPLEEPNAD